MAKHNNLLLLLIIGIIVLAFVGPKGGLFGIASGSSVNRVAPSSVNPSQSFSVTYSTSGAPAGKWFVAWEDTITGGCTPSSNKDFMANENGGDKSTTVTFTAPSSGSCTFSGFYQYAGETQKTMPSLTVSICNRRTEADTDCSGSVNFNELISYASKWKSQQVTLNQLLEAAQAWVTS